MRIKRQQSYFGGSFLIVNVAALEGIRVVDSWEGEWSSELHRNSTARAQGGGTWGLTGADQGLPALSAPSQREPFIWCWRWYMETPYALLSTAVFVWKLLCLCPVWW